MVVIMLEKVSSSVRGELTRWMLELRPGVFVGNISALVRDKLWEVICLKLRGGAAFLLHNADTEQGFTIRSSGDSSRIIQDFDGLLLTRIP
jgi:CRISPR-associated protein Cas2